MTSILLQATAVREPDNDGGGVIVHMSAAVDEHEVESAFRLAPADVKSVPVVRERMVAGLRLLADRLELP